MQNHIILPENEVRFWFLTPKAVADGGILETGKDAGDGKKI
jgi:hypothetical protein